MKIQTTLVILLIGVFFSCCEKNDPLTDIETQQESVDNLKAAKYNTKNWMTVLSDKTKLNELSIPGTHNSGARFEDWSSTAKCQHLTIGEQLNAGVRFLDVRCRHFRDGFTIHHGVKYQKLTFDGVLVACWKFLRENPGETIIISVKSEHTSKENTRSYEETFDSYVDKNRKGWYLDKKIPTLGQVRGKVVLFRRFGSTSSNKGLKATYWPDNKTFQSYNGSFSIRVQDEYTVKNNWKKWGSITDNLHKASTQNPNWLYVNFTSGTKSGIFGIPNIKGVSNFMNPKIEDYFKKNKSGRYGIVNMDFANQYRCKLIIDTNFN